MPSYQELQAQIKALQEQAESLRKSEQASTLADIIGKMQAYGITVEQVNGALNPGRRSIGTKASVVAPKYRNAAGETWSGRGKRPRWLADALASGSKLEDFLI